VRLAAFDICQEANATGVVLEFGTVQAVEGIVCHWCIAIIIFYTGNVLKEEYTERLFG
jgi:hypothetical protein